MTNLTPTEYSEQVAFVQWLEFKHIPYWHTPNSTYTKSWNQKRRNVALGVKAGIPDIFCIVKNGTKLIGIEMKRTKGGVISSAQQEWIETLDNADVPVMVCKGATEAIRAVELQEVKS